MLCKLTAGVPQLDAWQACSFTSDQPLVDQYDWCNRLARSPYVSLTDKFSLRLKCVLVVTCLDSVWWKTSFLLMSEKRSVSCQNFKCRCDGKAMKIFSLGFFSHLICHCYQRERFRGSDQCSEIFRLTHEWWQWARRDLKTLTACWLDVPNKSDSLTGAA